MPAGQTCGKDGQEPGAVVRKGSAQAWICLIEKNRVAKTAFRIAPAYQGRGLAAEAVKAIVDFCFAHTELRRIWTDANVRNAASWSVLEKRGFAREGMIRQGKMVNTWCDHYIYGLLKTDLEEKQEHGHDD